MSAAQPPSGDRHARALPCAVQGMFGARACSTITSSGIRSAKLAQTRGGHTSSPSGCTRMAAGRATSRGGSGSQSCVELSQNDTTVDVQGLAGDCPRFVRDEEHHRCSNVLRFIQDPEWRSRRHGSQPVLAANLAMSSLRRYPSRHHVSFCHARTHRIHTDPLSAELGCGHSSHGYDRTLRTRICDIGCLLPPLPCY